MISWLTIRTLESLCFQTDSVHLNQVFIAENRKKQGMSVTMTKTQQEQLQIEDLHETLFYLDNSHCPFQYSSTTCDGRGYWEWKYSKIINILKMFEDCEGHTTVNLLKLNVIVHLKQEIFMILNYISTKLLNN